MTLALAWHWTHALHTRRSTVADLVAAYTDWYERGWRSGVRA